MVIREEINNYLHYCKFQKELDDKTIRAYKADLKQFITLMGEDESNLNKEKLNYFLLYLHNRYKQKTVKRKIASVKALFHYFEEEERLLDYLYREKSSEKCSEWKKKFILRDIAVIETLFATGLRISELRHLQSRYFDLKNGVLCIRGKGGKEKYLQIGNDDVLSVLNVYKNSFGDAIKEHGYFFVNRYGNPLSEQSARRMIHKYADAIQADMNITPHMFRHSFATYLMEEDVNIRYI